ncbi:MAG: Ig-like domain-containing protein, partial [Burkholderiaceae bacterium]|nr:Ig-like domain-containing protein [Burkholderiaceae bacterium]
SVDELTPLSLNLSATDADIPPQPLTYSLISGPVGLSVTTNGVVSWTPTEAQGPGVYSVAVRVTDDGVPALSADASFPVTVLEVNSAPVLAPIANQTLDELAPFSMTLSATDADLPAQPLTYSLVSGPSGLSVSTTGVVSWTPTEAQGPGTHAVLVEVSDTGTPALTDRKQFTLVVNEVPDSVVVRTVWQIGTDEDPAILPYRPTAEFGPQNDKNDLRPGKVTRLPGDPEYVAASNPTADDDFFFSGQYPAGFNGLTLPLNVPNDEPPIAWERAHTVGDRTNRFHFILDPTQVTGASSFRLNCEWVAGGSTIGGTVQPGFADHDMVVRFQNPSGIATELFAQRISQSTNLVLRFAASTVQAMAGANSIEIVRTGPTASGVSFFVQYDYLRLESQPVGNTPPTLATPPSLTITPLGPLSLSLGATDADLPAQTLTYSRLSGPEGLTVSPAGLLTWPAPDGRTPGLYDVAVRVTDNGIPPMKSDAAFIITVGGGNVPPVLSPVAPASVDELTPLSLNLSATDADIPPQPLTYSLISGPVGLSVTTNGVVSWTP